MPGLDSTGPLSLGPMTRWGSGFYATSLGLHRNQFWLGVSPGFYGDRVLSRSGQRRDRGWRHWYYATGLPLAGQELSMVIL